MPLLPGRPPRVPGAIGDHEARIRALERQREIQGMPHVHLRGTQSGVTFVDGVDQVITYPGQLLVPINNGGVIDDSVFAIPGSAPWSTVRIMSPGVYYAETRAGWFRDWGAVRINLLYTHSSGEVFPVSDSYGFTDSLPSEPGVTFKPIGTESHEQTAVARRGFIIVDEYAGIVDITTELTNSSGVNRTFSSPSNIGAASLFVIRLSPGSHSNP